MTSSEPVVVLADLWMQPGKRPELEEAARQAGAILRRQPGFVAGRLLHFSGGPYFYVFETTWTDRAAWEAFWTGDDALGVRAIFDSWLLQPFAYRVHDVKVVV
ncbi:MAG: hypothetical protein KatS3mg060_0182 [Dehalococcoidia bacterium]|jgi:heme-degrading monooxygenase HmoA|nr:MAG: hypothetical protein KatS3mg060_0182 [Dehalococcoidia bacterium]